MVSTDVGFRFPTLGRDCVSCACIPAPIGCSISPLGSATLARIHFPIGGVYMASAQEVARFSIAVCTVRVADNTPP